MGIWRALPLIPLLSLGCGSQATLEFQPGSDDREAPVTTVDPPGGVFRELPAEVRLTADEPAIIHFTIDGSTPTAASPSEASPVLLTGLDGATTLRFFAVDAAGNAETERLASYTIDLASPSAVSGFSVVVVGSAAGLSWTNPIDTDFAGVLVARSRGILDAPVDGQTYDVETDLSAATEVLYVGTAEAFDDPGLAPQYLRYGIWAFDAVHNYSRISVGDGNIAIAPRSATVTVNVAALTATVTGATPVLALSAGTPTYAAGTLSVPLTLSNLAVREVHNPKVVVMSTSAGISFSDADAGASGGKPQRYFGPGLLTGGAATRTLTFTGVGPAATVILDVQVVEHASVLFPEWDSTVVAALAGDCGTGTVTTTIAGSDASEGLGNMRDYGTAVLSADGTHLFAAARQSTRIDRIDLVTLQPTTGVSLGYLHSKASVGSLKLDLSGKTLYALLTDGNHAPRWSSSTAQSEVYLVRLDAATLVETGRLRLSTPMGEKIRGRRMALSPDGTTLAIPVRDFGSIPAGWIAFVRLSDFTEVDSDPVTEGTQALLVSPTAGPTEVEYGLDGTTLYGNGSNGFQNRVLIVDVASQSLSTIATTNPNTLTVAPDGRLFIGTWSGVRVYDPATGGALTTVPGTSTGGSGSVELTRAGLLITREDDATSIVDRVTGEVKQTWAHPGGQVGGNWVVVSPY